MRVTFQKRGSHRLAQRWRSLVGIGLFVPGCTVATFTNEHDPSATNADVAIVNNRWSCPFCIGLIQQENGTVVFDVKKNGATDPLRLTPGNYVISAGYKDPYSGRAASML